MTAPRRSKHVLVLTKLLPLPADNGGRQRTLATLQLLLEQGHDVTIAALAAPDADVAGLAELGVRVLTAPWPTTARDRLLGLARSGSMSAARFWSTALAQQVRDEAERRPLDVLLLEYVQLAPYARQLPAGSRVLMSHNVESELFASYARSVTAPRELPKALAARAESRAVRRLEREVLSRVDLVSVVSDLDRGRLPGRASAPVVVCPNGWTTSPELPPSSAPVVVFVASLDWTPNVQAATWFTGNVWPLVTAAHPAARLLLVGRDPAAAVRALAGAGVEVTGTVPSVEPYLAQAAVAVAPLRTGGGSRLKILEALAAGRPVVATPVGAEGLDDLVDHGLSLAEEPPEFAAALLALLSEPALAAAEGARGREAVLAGYSWGRTLAPLLDWVATR